MIKSWNQNAQKISTEFRIGYVLTAINGYRHQIITTTSAPRMDSKHNAKHAIKMAAFARETPICIGRYAENLPPSNVHPIRNDFGQSIANVRAERAQRLTPDRSFISLFGLAQSKGQKYVRNAVNENGSPHTITITRSLLMWNGFAIYVTRSGTDESWAWVIEFRRIV